MSTRQKSFTNYHHHVVSLLHHWNMHGYEMQWRPFNKVINIMHGVFEWKMHKVHLKSRPFLVRLNTSAICNLRCLPCLKKESFKLKPGQSREPFIMSESTFDEIINETGHATQRMTFHITGEALMNKNLFSMIKKASTKKIFTYFSSNYNLMSSELIAQMFDSGLSKIKIAFDGFTQQTYNNYRVGGSVEKLKELIALTMEEKRKRKVKKPVVEVQIITFHHVIPEIGQIKEFCLKHGVDKILTIPDGCNFDGFHKKEIQGKPLKKCFWPWLQTAIDSDGNVYPCGQDFDGVMPLGNINIQSFEEIWNGELYKETRRFLSGKSTEKKQLNLRCYNCPSGFGKSGLWAVPRGEPLVNQMK